MQEKEVWDARRNYNMASFWIQFKVIQLFYA